MDNTLHGILGEKPYHSIGHLPGSRVGPGDHTIDAGVARYFTDPATWEGPQGRIVAQEKLDGTCVCVIRDGDNLIPALRSGHRAWTSPHEQHHRFAEWADENRMRFLHMLEPAERVCGEWMAQAHGIRYDRLPSLFFAFDIRSGDRWLPTLEVMARCQKWGIATVPLLYYGLPLGVEHLKRLTNRSAFRTTGPAEGVVLRRERGDRRLEVAKWVRQDHRPGMYLPEVSGSVSDEPLWHEVVEVPTDV